MSHIDLTSRAVVLDASIVLKWYLSESDALEAKKWHHRIKEGKITAVVPDLLFLEVSNSLLRRHNLLFAEVSIILNDLETLGLEVISMDRFPILEIISLAAGYSLSTYDALYLQIAKVTNYPLLTADKQLLKAAPEETRSLK